MKKYCKCNISLKKVLQYCKSCNKQYFANTLDFSLILAEYSLILLEKKRLHRKYCLHTMKQDLCCLQLPFKTPQSFNTKISGTLGVVWLHKK